MIEILRQSPKSDHSDWMMGVWWKWSEICGLLPQFPSVGIHASVQYREIEPEMFALCLADDVCFCSSFFVQHEPRQRTSSFQFQMWQRQMELRWRCEPQLGSCGYWHQIGKANKDSQHCAQLQLRCSEDFHHRPVLVLWAYPRWSMMALGLWQISMMSFKVFWEILCRLNDSGTPSGFSLLCLWSL